jgi:hypothetical protein
VSETELSVHLDGLSESGYSLIILPGGEVHYSHKIVDGQGERVTLQGAVDTSERLVGAAERGAEERTEVQSGAKIWIESEGVLETGFGDSPIPIVEALHQAEGAMGVSEIRIEFESAKRGGLGAWHGVVGVHATEGIPEVKIRIGDTRVGGGVERIEIEGLLKVLYRFLETRLGAFVPKVAPAEIGVVSLWMDLAR